MTNMKKVSVELSDLYLIIANLIACAPQINNDVVISLELSEALAKSIVFHIHKFAQSDLTIQNFLEYEVMLNNK